VFTRLHPRLWLLHATWRRQARESFDQVLRLPYSVADAPPPDGAGAAGWLSWGAGLLSQESRGEESSPAPSKRKAKMNTTENLTSTGCPVIAPQSINQIIKPIKFPAQPQEWKIVSLRECAMPENMQRCETPDEAAA
jgi:hypothetical protein